MKWAIPQVAWWVWLGLGAAAAETVQTGGRLPDVADGLRCWWALSSSAKIRPAEPAPANASEAVEIRAAANEWESVQIVLRSDKSLEGLRLVPGGFVNEGGGTIPPEWIRVLEARQVDIATPTDGLGEAGKWPDPLVPVTTYYRKPNLGSWGHHGSPFALESGAAQAFWLQFFVPKETAAGTYRGSVRLTGDGIDRRLPVELTVYDFTLPDRMTCRTAFGFSPGEVFRYHKATTEDAKRGVLDAYLWNFARHHVSPYDPAPLDRIKVTWPEVKPPRTVWDDWEGLRIVENEVHAGKGALLIHDDRTDRAATASYTPLIAIPETGLHLRFWYRTAIPGHRFIVSLNHYDGDRKWMSGCNNDMTLKGDGRWQEFDRVIEGHPEGAEYVRFHARATRWTDGGELLGLVWYDEVSLTDAGSGKELIRGGDFEVKVRTEPVAPLETLVPRFDFTEWDRAMEKAIDEYGFNTFRLSIPGLGGGTFHQLYEPELLGFGEDAPEYPVLLDSYCRQLQAHLREKGWLDEAFVYWFDEPSPDQYAFVKGGFEKLKRSCPDIARMLTEQVETGLVGGPNIWCPISNAYDHAAAEERREHGEEFWWYVCTGPKAPYAGLFIDHPAPEMRIWLWQTFQRGIDGILVWHTNYWTSETAYPDGLQDPYADPMSWTRGYGVPKGERRPWGNGDGRFIYPPLPGAEPSRALRTCRT